VRIATGDRLYNRRITQSRYPISRQKTLVGRDVELSAFDALLGALDAGESAAVVLSGEPGIGKTALIGEVLQRGRDRGYQTLSARASEFELDLPFAAFADALEGTVDSLVGDRRALVDDERLALLATVVPSLGPRLSRAPREAHPDERHLLLRALHESLELLAGERPFLLALDDLQWADPASIDLVCRLLHRGLSNRSLLLLASRPGQSEPRLRAAFGDAERHGQALRIELGPLGTADAKELLGREVDPALSESLYCESGGNPFYLEQLILASRIDPPPAGDMVPAQPWVPQLVSAAIGSELNGLSPSARILLQGAAVVGDPFEPELAVETAGLTEQNALDDLDELLEYDLIRVTDSPRRFCFRHPIVRRAVYEAAGAGWRLQAHGRSAAALRARGAPAMILAPHIERSARAGDSASAAVMVQAGQQLMSRSPATAAHWFEIASDLTPEREENLQLRLGLMVQHAIALGLAGEIEAAREETCQLLAHAPPELRRQATTLCVGFDTLLGRQADARRLLLDELTGLHDQLGQDAAELKCELAFTYFHDADWQAIRRWSRAALAADCLDIVKVGSLAILALAEFSLANPNGVQEPASEAAALFDRRTDEEVATHLSVAFFLAQADIHAERLADAVHHTERTIGISRASGQRLVTIGLLAIQAQALTAMGRVTELAAVAETATETALLSKSEVVLCMAMGVRALANIMTGDLHSALRFAEHATSAELGPTSPIAASACLVHALALLEIDEPGRCRELLTGPEGEPRLPPPLFEGWGYEILIGAEVALGNLTQAEELTQRSAESAERFGAMLPLARARRALALVSLERSETQTAVTAALESCEAAERVGAEVEAGRSQTLAGRALAANGDRTAAITTLQSAHQRLLTCGALHYSDQAAKELRKLGRAMPRRSTGRHGKPSILGLTEREREVMEQVAAGRTNREIADDLFLSARTVDRHLARIFEKLDVHSRAAASSAFARASNRPSL
jgi:DNA-binding CsgD family transcriptional regulator